VSAWDLASVAGFAAAGAPPAYFAIRLRATNRRFASLSLLLATALFVHAAFHVFRAIAGPGTGPETVETVSAALVLAFALVYWMLRRRESLGG
jgi:hypothetical protein